MKLKKLAHFSWKKVVLSGSEDVVTFSCYVKANRRHVREIQQMRASLYLLCSLAAVI